MAKYKLKCQSCDWHHIEDQNYVTCPQCGGFLEVKFDQMPTEITDSNYKSIFRFHPVMPFEPKEEFLDKEDYEDTPIVHAAKLSSKLGIEVYYKDETIMPSGTWKDREGFVSVHRMHQNNIDDMYIFSSGNTGTSVARSISKFAHNRLHLVVPKASEERLKTYQQFFDKDYVKVSFFEGSNDECIDEAKKRAEASQYAVEGGFSNYARREGLKLLALEVLANWDKTPDWYVQSIAGGIGVYSYFKAHKDLGIEEKCPRILGVQAKVCAPMVNAWKDNSPTLEQKHIPEEVTPSDYVRVLRTRAPKGSYPILKKIMDQVDGHFEDVEDQEIHEALRLFYLDDYYKQAHAQTGRVVGLEAATALAGVVKSVQTGLIKPKSVVLLNVSGAAKKGDVKMEWIEDLL